jgi:ligand-binding sensor domain-containing protein
MTSFRRYWFLITALYSFFFFKVKAQDYVLNYEQLTTKQGLANDFVTCIAQDNQGFMWIGTQDGLCRYDGHSYKIYKTDVEKNHILLSNSITSLALLNDSLIYVGTEAGLHIFNSYNNTIIPIKEFENQHISSIYIDDTHTTWVIAHKKTIYTKKITQNKWQNLNNKYLELNDKMWVNVTQQKVNNQSKIFFIEEKDIKESASVYVLHGQNERDNWKPLFSESGVYMETVYNNTFLIIKNAISYKDTINIYLKDEKINIKYIDLDFKQKYRQLNEFGAKIYQNYLYVPLQRSILVVDLNTYKTVKRIDIEKTKTTLNNIIKDIFIDTTGNLWVATFGSGVLLFPTYSVNTIKGYRFDKDNSSKGLSSTSTRAIYQNPIDQKLWIGTYSEDRVIDVFSKKNKKELLPIQISYTFWIKEDKKNATILWAATYNGIVKIEKQTPKVLKSYFTLLLPRAMEVSSDSTILFSDDEYIYVFNTQKEIIQSKKIVNKAVYLYQDKNKIVWIGTETDGFASWNLITDKITYYNPEKNATVKSLQVKCIYEDTKGKFWIATTTGLYLFDKTTKQTKKFTTKNGLPHNLIYGILEDDNYNLWMSTNKGISKFNIKKETFENFDVNDGLQDNEYNTHSFYKSKKGELFFGGINGVDAFFPNDLKRNKHAPNLVLTGFKP